MRFTLRTLFIGITLVAVALMCWLGYRQATLCRVQWLPPGSTAAKALFPTPTIHKLDDGWFSFTYYARSRDIQSLYRALPTTGDRNLQIDRQSMVIKSPAPPARPALCPHVIPAQAGIRTPRQDLDF